MEPVFAMVSFETYPGEQADRCSLETKEFTAAALQAEFKMNVNRDREALAFLAGAQIGQYIQVRFGGGLIFRTR
jgi:hypothetical protein